VSNATVSRYSDTLGGIQRLPGHVDTGYGADTPRSGLDTDRYAQTLLDTTDTAWIRIQFKGVFPECSATYTAAAAVHPSLGQNYAIAQHLLLPVHVIFTCVAVFNNAQKSFYI
jgi:hypothetical protein